MSPLLFIVRTISTACHRWYSAIRNVPFKFDHRLWWISFQKLNRHCKWCVYVLCEKAPTPMRSTWVLFYFLRLFTALYVCFHEAFILVCILNYWKFEMGIYSNYLSNNDNNNIYRISLQSLLCLSDKVVANPFDFD